MAAGSVGLCEHSFANSVHGKMQGELFCPWGGRQKEAIPAKSKPMAGGHGS